MNKQCRDCSAYKRCQDSYASWIFFAIGLVATIAVRVVTVLAHLDPVYGKIAWYVGVGGFFVFFAYKYAINQSLTKLVAKNNLIDKVSGKKELSHDEARLIGKILCELSSNKERMNYFFIFAVSAIALVIAIYFDFIK
ncbi:MAG: hypothetical protein FJZ10_02790 [Candidatus Omnitrophica bacterium]|nr:hypothetical protein [Candidatus Omnitrophota bacterium]